MGVAVIEGIGNNQLLSRQILGKNQKSQKVETSRQFGIRISALLRDSFGKNQSALAKKLGADPSVVKPWIDGTAMPGGYWLARMAELGLDVHWLLTGEKCSSSREPDQEKSETDSAEMARLRGDLSNALTRIETLTNQLNEATREGISQARRALELEQECEKVKSESATRGLRPEEMADVEDIHKALGLRGPVDVSQVLHAAATSFRAVTRDTRQSIDDEADAEIKREGGQGGKAMKRRRARSSI